MNNYFKIKVDIAPYRTFEEEFEIYTNDVDYVWKATGEFLQTGDNSYDGVVVFNQQTFPAKAITNGNNMCVMFAKDDEAFKLMANGNIPSHDNVLFFGVNKQVGIADSEIGFGDCYILAKQADEKIITNVTNRIKNAVRKDSTILDYTESHKFNTQNTYLMRDINAQAGIIRYMDFNVFKFDSPKRLYMYPLLAGAYNSMCDYILDERMINPGETFILDQEMIDKIYECIEEGIKKQDVTLTEDQHQYVKTLCYKLTDSAIFKGNKIGVMLGIITSGCHDIKDICEESPYQFLIYEFVAINESCDAEWIIDAFEQMSDIPPSEARGTILLKALQDQNKEITQELVNEFFPLFECYHTIMTNTKITNKQMSSILHSDLKKLKKQEEKLKASGQKIKIWFL